jgi:hypothetical protein
MTLLFATMPPLENRRLGPDVNEMPDSYSSREAKSVNPRTPPSNAFPYIGNVLATALKERRLSSDGLLAKNSNRTMSDKSHFTNVIGVYENHSCP